MNINCINNKIANANGIWLPTILKAILNLYEDGFRVITHQMVRQKCNLIDTNFPKSGYNAAISNAMRNSIQCGGRMVNEYSEKKDFTVAFEGNGNSLDIDTPKKTSQKVESKKKDKLNSTSKPHYSNVLEIEKLNLSKNFKVVMICAGGKNDSFFSANPNDNFVNNPTNDFEHHPDDPMNEEEISWREFLINNQNDSNLLEAYNLYTRDEYKYLHRKYKNNFYILSAGWGIVNSEFKLPNYDITFSSSSKNKNAIRKNKSIYKDFNQFYDVNMAPLISPEEDIIYVGGKDYLELFYQLTENLPNRKIIYFNSKANPKPIFGNYLYRRYFINYSTNWHYELAKKISNGIIP